MKDIILKILDPKMLLTIFIISIVSYGIYKGIIGINDIWDWMTETVSSWKTSVHLGN